MRWSLKLIKYSRRDKNDNWEAIRTHSEVVTCTVFAPYPLLLIRAAIEVREKEGSWGEGTKEEKINEGKLIFLSLYASAARFLF